MNEKKKELCKIPILTKPFLLADHTQDVASGDSFTPGFPNSGPTVHRQVGMALIGSQTTAAEKCLQRFQEDLSKDLPNQLLGGAKGPTHSPRALPIRLQSRPH